MTFVTIKSFDNIMEAYMLRSRIESEGIECFLFDEEIVALNTLYTWAVGGVKLKVLDKDVPQVMEILKDISETPLTNEQGSEISCPSCNSVNINNGHSSVSGIIRNIFGLFWFFNAYNSTIF